MEEVQVHKEKHSRKEEEKLVLRGGALWPFGFLSKLSVLVCGSTLVLQISICIVLLTNRHHIGIVRVTTRTVEWLVTPQIQSSRHTTTSVRLDWQILRLQIANGANWRQIIPRRRSIDLVRITREAEHVIVSSIHGVSSH